MLIVVVGFVVVDFLLKLLLILWLDIVLSLPRIFVNDRIKTKSWVSCEKFVSFCKCQFLPIFFVVGFKTVETEVCQMSGEL